MIHARKNYVSRSKLPLAWRCVMTGTRTAIFEAEPLLCMPPATGSGSEVLFTVKPGEIAYISDFSANALTFCLSNIDHAEQSITALKEKYPLLRDRSITNLTAQSGFEPWPSSDASDRGKGLCQF